MSSTPVSLPEGLSATGVPRLIGSSPAFLQVVESIHQFAPYDVPLLLQGETGTGKDVVARTLHYSGHRRDQPFIPVNCGALPESLFESQLFGHARGAFTDARCDQPGLVELANRGTLFLDEVDTLSIKGQIALLRFLQDKCYRPLGSSVERKSNVRILAATNADLAEKVEKGLFRRDLLYRLNVLFLRVPPLRERDGDAGLLAEHFVGRYCETLALSPKTIHDHTRRWFDVYSWPGNIRELENVIFRSLVACHGPVLDFDPPTARMAEERRRGPDRRTCRNYPLPFQLAKRQAIAVFERDYLTYVLRQAKGNVSEAARLAGKERSAVGKLMKKHRIGREAYSTAPTFKE